MTQLQSLYVLYVCLFVFYPHTQHLNYTQTFDFLFFHCCFDTYRIFIEVTVLSMFEQLCCPCSQLLFLFVWKHTESNAKENTQVTKEEGSAASLFGEAGKRTKDKIQEVSNKWRKKQVTLSSGEFFQNR